jgi:hypothetical protein
VKPAGDYFYDCEALIKQKRNTEWDPSVTGVVWEIDVGVSSRVRLARKPLSKELHTSFFWREIIRLLLK